MEYIKLNYSLNYLCIAYIQCNMHDALQTEIKPSSYADDHASGQEWVGLWVNILQ